MINCEIDPISTLSSVCVITNSKDTRTFAITDRKVYVPVGNLSTKENEKLKNTFLLLFLADVYSS